MSCHGSEGNSRMSRPKSSAFLAVLLAWPLVSVVFLIGGLSSAEQVTTGVGTDESEIPLAVGCILGGPIAKPMIEGFNQEAIAFAISGLLITVCVVAATVYASKRIGTYISLAVESVLILVWAGGWHLVGLVFYSLRIT